MKQKKKAVIAAAAVVLLMLLISLLIVWPSISLPRQTFRAPEASYHSWDDILSNPKPISIRTRSTGIMQTDLSGIMNLDNADAIDIEDETIEIPVMVGIVRHQEAGTYLIDAGLDKSYVYNQHGTIKGLLVEGFLGKGSQEPGSDAASILERNSLQLKGVFLTHLHMDHTAGIADLPKDIPYIAGKNEPYANFRFLMQSDHLKGIDALQEFDFTEAVELPPLGRGIDVFGDGSLWAISSGGHSKGHVIFFINGLEGPVLFTGDACNNHYQFETGIGPGYYSSDTEGAQRALDQIILFKEQYPEVMLAYGHDLKTN